MTSFCQSSKHATWRVVLFLSPSYSTDQTRWRATLYKRRVNIREAWEFILINIIDSFFVSRCQTWVFSCEVCIKVCDIRRWTLYWKILSIIQNQEKRSQIKKMFHYLKVFRSKTFFLSKLTIICMKEKIWFHSFNFKSKEETVKNLCFISYLNVM